MYDDEFIPLIQKVSNFNKENLKVTEMLFSSFSDIHDNIGDIVMHDLVWKERFNVNVVTTYYVTNESDAEYPLRFIDLEMRTYENDEAKIVCPLCKSITELNEYLNILRNQMNDLSSID